jgi:hypothetical protein
MAESIIGLYKNELIHLRGGLLRVRLTSHVWDVVPRKDGN